MTLAADKLPPLVKLSTAADVLNTSAPAVMELIDNGDLLFAFNVSSRRARKQEVRILTESLNAYVERRPCKFTTTAAAVASILPSPGKFPALAVLKASVLRRRLRIEHQLAGQLIRSGELKCKTGPRRPVSAVLTYESCAQWLNSRAIGPGSYAPARPGLPKGQPK